MGNNNKSHSSNSNSSGNNNDNSKKEEVKKGGLFDLVNTYGNIAFGTHLALFPVWYVAIYLALKNGVDVQAIILSSKTLLPSGVTEWWAGGGAAMGNELDSSMDSVLDNG